jgi:membrane fusion protein (multidrug efflux system)
VITARNVHPGALVGTGKDDVPMFQVETVDRLRLVVPVPEAQAGALSGRARVAFTVPAYPGETFYGTVSRIAHSLDPKTRSMPVELDVSNPAGRLSAGMYPAVKWPTRGNRPALLVPPSSIVMTSERTFVVRVNGGAAEWVDIRKGATQGDLVEIIGPLRDGDIVLRRGSDEVRQGTHLTVRLTATPKG